MSEIELFNKITSTQALLVIAHEHVQHSREAYLTEQAICKFLRASGYEFTDEDLKKSLAKIDAKTKLGDCIV